MNKEKIKRIVVLAACAVLLGRAVYRLFARFFGESLSAGAFSAVGADLLGISFWLALFLLPAALRRTILLPWSVISLIGSIASPVLSYAMQRAVWQQGLDMTGEPILWYTAIQAALELISWQSVCLLGWLTRRSTEKAAALMALLSALAHDALYFVFLHQISGSVSGQAIQSAAYSLLATLPVTLLLFLHPVLTQPVLALKKEKM